MSDTLPEMKLELIPIPVSDVDRTKAFYVDKVGFNCDHDVTPGNGMRIVQLTPPGSACSIVIGTGMTEIDQIPPGSIKGIHLVVKGHRQIAQGTRQTWCGHGRGRRYGWDQIRRLQRP